MRYVGFDGRLHQGQLVLDRRLMHDAQLFFELAKSSFPNRKGGSTVHYKWDDDVLMATNISSGFNYRTIAGKRRGSLHGKYGVDINPRINPYIRYEMA